MLATKSELTKPTNTIEAKAECTQKNGGSSRKALFRQKPNGASRGVPAEGVDANPRTARGCGVGGDFPPIKKT